MSKTTRVYFGALHSHSRPEPGSNPPFGSDRESGCDMGHAEYRLIHACSFFFFLHDRTTCMHGVVVGLTVK